MRLTAIIAAVFALALACPVRAHEPRIVDVAYVQGVIVCDAAQRNSGFLFVRVARGTHLVVRWRTDEALTVRLTGYNIETRIPAGGEALMRVEANVPGLYAIERADGRHRTLIHLDIRP